jgi:hypothetical protein
MAIVYIIQISTKSSRRCHQTGLLKHRRAIESLEKNVTIQIPFTLMDLGACPGLIVMMEIMRFQLISQVHIRLSVKQMHATEQVSVM